MNDKTKDLEQERDELTAELAAMGAPKETVTVEDDLPEPHNPDRPWEEKPVDGESPMAAAARMGRQRSDPRFIEAAKRDPDVLDMGADFDLKMTLNDYEGQLEGYHTHWIVDKPGKIQRKLSQGYQPIYKHGIKVGDGPDDFNDNMDSWVSMVSGTLEGGAPQYSYALKIDQELYDMTKEKQRQSRVVDVEKQIQSGEYLKKEGDGRYVDQERTKFNFGH